MNSAVRIRSQSIPAPGQVKRTDNVTMAFGFEARVPFLDDQLAELSGCRFPP